MQQTDSSLYAAFQQRFQAEPDKLALTVPGGASYSYTDLDQEAARLAGFLLSAGCSYGDRVSVQVSKTPQALFLYLACLRVGLVFHPLNTDYTLQELRFFLGDAEPALVVCDPGVHEAMECLCAELGIAALHTLGSDGDGSLMAEAAKHEKTVEVAVVDGDDAACLLYSSGTTGLPKGIPVSHRNLLANAASLIEAWRFSSEDVLLHALPIHHAHGLFVGLNCVFLVGASLRWLPAFGADAVVDSLPYSTCFMGVPTYYTRLLDHPDFDAKRVRKIRVFISGSAPLQVEVFEAFEQRTGHRILERYGMSETGMNCSNPLAGERRPGSVGPPLPGVEVRIVDDAWRPLPAGNIGNLQVRGDNVFKGYWKLPEKTSEAFTDDGFFDTGDMAIVGDDSYVTIVGRTKDLVITGGLNVYPQELELVINQIDGVQESAVIGVPHPDFGEGLVAVVVAETSPSLNEECIVDALRKQVARFKVPKRVLFVAELPRNSMGKVQKNLLRDRYAELLIDGLSSQRSHVQE